MTGRTIETEEEFQVVSSTDLYKTETTSYDRKNNWERTLTGFRRTLFLWFMFPDLWFPQWRVFRRGSLRRVAALCYVNTRTSTVRTWSVRNVTHDGVKFMPLKWRTILVFNTFYCHTKWTLAIKSQATFISEINSCDYDKDICEILAMFVSYLMKLSAEACCVELRWLVNNELARIWKKAVVA
jgi:hypothetical protein